MKFATAIVLGIAFLYSCAEHEVTGADYASVITDPNAPPFATQVPTDEICDNGFDDDHDGRVDNGCFCDDLGETRDCWLPDPTSDGSKLCKSTFTCVQAGAEALAWSECKVDPGCYVDPCEANPNAPECQPTAGTGGSGGAGASSGAGGAAGAGGSAGHGNPPDDDTTFCTFKSPELTAQQVWKRVIKALDDVFVSTGLLDASALPSMSLDATLATRLTREIQITLRALAQPHSPPAFCGFPVQLEVSRAALQNKAAWAPSQRATLNGREPLSCGLLWSKVTARATSEICNRCDASVATMNTVAYLIHTIIEAKRAAFGEAYKFYCVASPLVLDLNGNGIVSSDARTSFDLLASGRPVQTAWVDPGDALLAIDRNHDGCIGDASELFGEASLGQRWNDGFSPLAQLDSDTDRAVSASDAAFEQLTLWRDNGDARCQPGELVSLEDAGITRLDLGYTRRSVIEASGSAALLWSSFTRSNGQVGKLVDVFFAYSR